MADNLGFPGLEHQNFILEAKVNAKETKTLNPTDTQSLPIIHSLLDKGAIVLIAKSH